MLDNLDAKTLVVGVRPREVAVGEQTAGVVTTHELEFFPVAHGGSVLWNVNLVFSCQGGRGNLPCAALCCLGGIAGCGCHEVARAWADVGSRFQFRVPG